MKSHFSRYFLIPIKGKQTYVLVSNRTGIFLTPNFKDEKNPYGSILRLKSAWVACLNSDPEVTSSAT